MTRSNYTVAVEDNLIFVVDLNLGGMSVTNDAENVVEKLYNEYGSLDRYIIIYKDSGGEIDELQTKNNEFYAFGSVGADSLSEAKEILANRLKELKESQIV